MCVPRTFSQTYCRIGAKGCQVFRAIELTLVEQGLGQTAPGRRGAPQAGLEVLEAQLEAHFENRLGVAPPLLIEEFRSQPVKAELRCRNVRWEMEGDMAQSWRPCHLSAPASSFRRGEDRMSDVLSLLALVVVAVVWSRSGCG